MARILVIEDEFEVREALRMMLEQEDHEVITASNGEEGTRIYARNPTDLIITDLLMPEKDGVETLLELRADFPDARIIAISGMEQDFLPRARIRSGPHPLQALPAEGADRCGERDAGVGTDKRKNFSESGLVESPGLVLRVQSVQHPNAWCHREGAVP